VACVAWLLLYTSWVVWPGSSTVVRSDEQVVLYPTFAFASPDRSQLHVLVHGRIFEPEFNDTTIELFLHLVGHLTERYHFKEVTSNPNFRQRFRFFLVDNEGDKYLTVNFAASGNSTIPVPLQNGSHSSGHFKDVVVLSKDTQQKLQRNNDSCIRFSVVAQDGRQFLGSAQLLNDSGISVVSDIDDTIKVTGILNKTELFENSFLRPFKAVKGMSELYQRWRRRFADKDIAFHYVSGSPWQFYEPLRELLDQEDFPAASWHLREFFKDWESFVSLITSPLQFKVHVISSIMRTFPHRAFIFVGDDGEHDPEVYATLAKQFPSRVIHAFIHHVNASSPDSVTSLTVTEAAFQRCKILFENAGLSPSRWTIYSDVEIPSLDEKLAL